MASRSPRKTGANGNQEETLHSVKPGTKEVVVIGGQSALGVPQGSALGQTIFNCFSNDLPSITRSEVGMFANDCTMFSTIHNSSDSEAVHNQMQQDLDNIQARADK